MSQPRITPPRGAQTPSGTQRERLLEAMTEVASQVGYLEASIAQVTSRAGVSRATFYELFKSKEDCFRATFVHAAGLLLDGMRRAAATSDWRTGARAALDALLGTIAEHPAAAWLVFIEGPASGAGSEETRAALRDEFRALTEAFFEATPSDGYLLDISPTALLGAMRRIVFLALANHAPDQLPCMLDDVLAWVLSYAVPVGESRWTLSPHVQLERAPRLDPAIAAPIPMPPEPERVPRGRHRLPPSVVARSHRERILQATATVMTDKGYADTTVADVVAGAGISRDVFYHHFSDKRHAFLEAQRRGVQETLLFSAEAFFAGRTWPERMWNVLHVLTEAITVSPGFAHLQMVESFTAGIAAIQYVQEMTTSYMVFLQEGYRYRPEAEALPRLFSQATIGAVFDVVRREVTTGRAAELPRMLPLLTYISIAPFTGVREAARIVEEIAAART
ncbi:MAG: TetR/AcrR family transcriptional regulator [Solirubrobacterales bacterium]|nr:TetR/AcrR family transcriptional regulator [Solirubrobacterales bacterium]